MKKQKVLKAVIKGVDKAKAKLDAVFSTPDEDRHGDKVEQNWDLKNFKNNPVLLNSHQAGDATEVIGKVEPIKVENGKLQGTVHFAAGENPKAKVIFDLYAGGFLKAFSVGFIPKSFDEEDSSIIKESELLEISAVPVGSNALALAKQKGIDVEELSGEEKQSPGSDAGIDNQAPEEEIEEVEDDSEEDEKENDEVENDVDEEEQESEEEEEDTEEEKSLTPIQKAKIATDRIRAKRKKTLIAINNLVDEFVELPDPKDMSKGDEHREKRKINKAVRNLLNKKSD